MEFTVSFTSVLIMLAYAVPGFIFVKTKMIRPDSIAALAKILMYLCQPCLAINAFYRAEFSVPLLKELGVFFAVSLALQIAILAVFYLIFHKKSEDVRYRVCTVATAFGNCSFIGIPLLEALLPDYPNTGIFSITFFVGMSILGWTLGSFLITKDRKYVSVKKALLNPGVLCLVVALPLFFTGFRLPESFSAVEDMVALLGKMSTPLCMLIMGMRLATASFRSLALDPLQYVTIAVKQLAMPLLGMAVIWFMPLPIEVRQIMVILCCCPVASVVLNFAEMLGEGQETAANLVLLGTIFSLITIPVITLLL